MLLRICQLCEHWRCERLYSPFGSKLNEIFVCTVKPFGIINVKSALVNSKFDDTESAILILVSFY